MNAYPLQWPVGRPRTKAPQSARFRVTPGVARDDLYDELERLGATSVTISSNAKLNLDGRPSANQPWTPDTGVSVYFTRKGQDLCVACDKWDTIHDNIRAIGLTIAAIRGIERWGTTEMVDAAFAGFAALPAPVAVGWWTVLGVSPTATPDEIERAFRAKAKLAHPDVGGSDEVFVRLDEARFMGLQARKEG